MTTFKINENMSIICEWKKTRNAFKHEATLLKDNVEIDKTKICYQNRTWESYEFESVIHKLLDKTNVLTQEEKDNFLKKIAKGESEAIDSQFKTIAGIAKLGEVFGQTIKEKNDWKARMLKAGLADKGLVMPEDWESLSEEDKETRLNVVIDNMA